MRRSPVWPLLQLLERLLQLVVRPRADRIAWISQPDYTGNAFHLYRHVLATRADLEHVWLVTDEDAARRIRDDFARFGASRAGHRLRVEHRHRPAGYLAYLRSRAVFHTHGAYKTTTRAHRRAVVSLWHGMPIKAVGALNTTAPNPWPTFGTHHLATSPLLRTIVAASFRVPLDRVLLCGLPRCDVLARDRPLVPTTEQARRAAGVEDDRPLVLWLPTYRTDRPTARPRSFLDELPPGLLERVEGAAARHGCRVVVKLHPEDALNHSSDALDLGGISLLRARDWLRGGIELYDLLAATDGLITDISSVLIDYLVTDRPIGMAAFDRDRYDRELLLPVSALRGSRRIHDLEQEGAPEDFFARVRSREPVPAADDDLSAWLYPEQGEGCETVLAAVMPATPRR